MKDSLVNIVPIACNLVELQSFTSDPAIAETIIQQDQAFGLKVTVAFGESGAIALMPLAMHIRVEFFAKALGSGETLDLGKATVTTKTGQFVYHPTLKLPKGPAKVGMLTDKLYQITAVLRVGASEGPSFIHGAIEGLALQTYQP